MDAELSREEKFWSGYDWPMNQEGINNRWNTFWREWIPAPNKEQLITMSIEDKSILSPAEKFDLLNARYDYPFKKEVESKTSPTLEYWRDISDGWSVASIFHKEPRPKVLLNPDGIEIPFGSTDIKALISYYYSKIQNKNIIMVGQKCGTPDPNTIDPHCENDLDAGNFHLYLGNKIGLEKRAFIIDLEKFYEEKYRPVIGYKTDVMNAKEPDTSSIEGTVKVLSIRTTLYFIEKANEYSWDTVLETPKQVRGNREYIYDLFLNNSDEIIGGQWKSSDRPDFLFTSNPFLQLQGEISKLGVLFND